MAIDFIRVSEAVSAARERRSARRKISLGWNEQARKGILARELAELRAVVCTRGAEQDPRVPFQPLTDYELMLLEDAVYGHQNNGSFRVLDTPEGSELFGQYLVLRHNHVTYAPGISPQMFRAASDKVTAEILAHAGGQFWLDPSETGVIFIWRAGLAFAESGISAGFRRFGNIGAYRDEETLETKVYHNGITPEFVAWIRDGKRKVLGCDPMFATGGTDDTLVSLLCEAGIPEEQIILLSVISAPEGIDRVLYRHPKVRVLVGDHDECLNENGYITGAGLGDYGDQWMASVTDLLGELERWQERGIMTHADAQAFWTRTLEKDAELARSSVSASGWTPQR